MIPRKLALRIWSACLLSQADRMRALATGGPSGRTRTRLAGSADKAPGRLALADRLRRHGEIVEAWSNTPERCKGGDLDPAVVGLVSAYLYRHGPALAELRSSGRLAGECRSDDEVAVIRLILEIP